MSSYNSKINKRRKPYRQKGGSIGGIIFLILVFALTVGACIYFSVSKNNKDNTPVTGTGDITGSVDSNNGTGGSTETSAAETEPVITGPLYEFPTTLYSRCGICIRLSDGMIMAEKNAVETIYPASLTKIMTAVVALENISDMGLTATLSQSMFDYLIAQNASVAGFSAGDTVSAKDLLYASLLASGADGSIGLAELVAGSEESFVDLMNAKAEELGMTGTNFVNTTGLHDDDHYSTVNDLVRLTVYALQNETFRKVITSGTYTTAPTTKYKNGITLSSTVLSTIKNAGLTNDYIIGGKTGYTYQAGLCLMSLADIDGEEYLLITVGAGDGESKPKYNAMDAVAVFNMIADLETDTTAGETE